MKKIQTFTALVLGLLFTELCKLDVEVSHRRTVTKQWRYYDGKAHCYVDGMKSPDYFCRNIPKPHHHSHHKNHRKRCDRMGLP